MSPKVTTACHAMKPLKFLAAVCSNPFLLWRDVSSWRSSEWKRTNYYQRNEHLSSHIFPSKRKLYWLYKWKCRHSRTCIYIFSTLLFQKIVYIKVVHLFIFLFYHCDYLPFLLTFDIKSLQVFVHAGGRNLWGKFPNMGSRFHSSSFRRDTTGASDGYRAYIILYRLC